MDAILATSSNNVIYQKRTFAQPLKPWEKPNDQIATKKIIPWLKQPEYALDLTVFKEFTKGKILWCTWGTYQSLPHKVTSDPNRAFKILSKSLSGFTANSWFSRYSLKTDHMPAYTFENLHNTIDNLGSNHILIGGPSAYKEFLPKCSNVVWSTINCNYYGDNTYFKTNLSHFYSPLIYQSASLNITLYSKNLTGFKDTKNSLPI